LQKVRIAMYTKKCASPWKWRRQRMRAFASSATFVKEHPDFPGALCGGDELGRPRT